MQKIKLNIFQKCINIINRNNQFFTIENETEIENNSKKVIIEHLSKILSDIESTPLNQFEKFRSYEKLINEEKQNIEKYKEVIIKTY